MQNQIVLVCSKCDKSLDSSNFFRNPNAGKARQGFGYVCKKCYKKTRKKVEKSERICDWCDYPFLALRGKYCSDKCRKEANNFKGVARNRRWRKNNPEIAADCQRKQERRTAIIEKITRSTATLARKRYTEEEIKIIMMKKGYSGSYLFSLMDLAHKLKRGKEAIRKKRKQLESRK